ncbi:MAG: glycosyltransferase family 9 protein [Gammaproteobacteria bacterium]|nr:glycosyltransferase family 9 protein [Gammaproteobacteria bacterium]
MNGAPLLLVSLSNIGDAIMTTPVLEAMHALRPDARIDIVADRRSRIVFEGCPYRGRILHKDKEAPLRGIAALVRELRATEYEWAVDLRTDFLPVLLRAKRRLLRWRARAYGEHAVERHMGVIAALHANRAIPATTLWLGPGDESFGREVKAGLKADRLLVLGPGANSPPKIWPAPHFVELIAELQQDFDAVALLGDEADRSQSAAVAAGSVLPCLDLCGRTSIPEAASVLSVARAFVGNDSGLGHLASATGTVSLTLFGPGDPARYRPWGARADWIAAADGELASLAPRQAAERLRFHLRALEMAQSR